MRRRAPRASVATPPPETELPLASPARQLLLSAGVLLCFGVSSLTQEALTTRTYDGATFRYRNVLLLLQSAASAVVAGAMMLARGPRPRAQRPPRGDYGRWAVVVGAYYASHWFGLASLPLLSYPVHVTLKSCKAIPVVVGERLLTARRREPAPPAAGRGAYPCAREAGAAQARAGEVHWRRGHVRRRERVLSSPRDRRRRGARRPRASRWWRARSSRTVRLSRGAPLPSRDPTAPAQASTAGTRRSSSRGATANGCSCST